MGYASLDGTEIIESRTFRNPSGFVFNRNRKNKIEASTFERIANTRKYLLRVTGRSRPKSPIKTTVEVVLQRRTPLDYGLFAADRLDLPARGRVYSYDSRQIKSGRDPEASTGTVKIATNRVITAQANHLDLDVDGDIILGKTPEGQDAEFTFRGSSPDVSPPLVTITPREGEEHQIHLLPGDALPTDPLDIAEMVKKERKRLRRNNDNDHHDVQLGNYRLVQESRELDKGDYYFKEVALGQGHSLSLKAVGGDINIYADSITIEEDSKFEVITDGGEDYGNVNIYPGGPASFNARSATKELAFNVTGDASTFRIFSNSNEPIILNHDGDFKGLIYAPFAPVTVNNTSAHGYGLLWGRTLDFSMHDTPYTFYTDTALQEAFLSSNVEIVSWKELRD